MATTRIIHLMALLGSISCCGRQISQNSPDASFGCGSYQCSAASQFCQSVLNGGAGDAFYTDYQCVELPQGCTTCNCLLDSGIVFPCWSYVTDCSSVDGGGLITTSHCAM